MTAETKEEIGVEVKAEVKGTVETSASVCSAAEVEIAEEKRCGENRGEKRRAMLSR